MLLFCCGDEKGGGAEESERCKMEQLPGAQAFIFSGSNGKNLKLIVEEI